MILDKVLIVHDYSFQKNLGGPKGYYFKCLDGNLPKNITSVNDEIKKLKSIGIQKKIKIRLDRFRLKKYQNKQLVNKLIKLPKYKYLYFHEMTSFQYVEHLISKDQIVIFQSHSPELPYDEFKAMGKRPETLIKIKKLQNKIFKRANVLVLPNEGCCSIYKSVIQDHHQVLYAQTGLKPIKADFEFPIVQENVVNLLYVGRRNEIKGFDVLIDTFIKACKQRKDLRLYLIGGGEVVSHPNIIDIGFSSQVYSWVKAMDFVLSPNQKSYFDLNILETIALGTPLIMTTTEGHHFFKDKQGILDVNQSDLLNVLLDQEKVNKTYKKHSSKHLKHLYEEELSGLQMKQNLKKCMDDVVNK